MKTRILRSASAAMFSTGGKNGADIAVAVPGSFTLDHFKLMAEAASAGLGIAYLPDRTARPFLDSGLTVMVLQDWCPRIPWLMLYSPGHRLTARWSLDVGSRRKCGGEAG